MGLDCYDDDILIFICMLRNSRENSGIFYHA